MAEEVASKRVKMETDIAAGQDAAEAAAAAADGGKPDGEISVKISSEVLRCRICLEPLRPPIFKVIICR